MDSSRDELRTAASPCTNCSHSAILHGSGGCGAFVRASAGRAARACHCERDAAQAECDALPKRRHLRIVDRFAE